MRLQPGALLPCKTIKSSRPAGTLHNQLAKGNKGPVGPEYGYRVRDRIHLGTPPTSKTIPKPIKSKPVGAGISRDHRDDLKRGSDRVTNPTRGRFFLHPLSGAKEGWRSETSNKFKKPQRLHKCPTLQNGGDPYPQEPAPKRGLASKSRPEGRLLFNPDKSTAQEVPMLPIQEQAISVQLSPLRPGLSPLGLYQDPEADSSSRTGAGDADDSLYRRYTPNGRDQGESQRPSIRPDIPHAMLGLHDKLGEDHFRTIPTPRVLGFCGGYHQHGAEPPRTEDQENSGGVPAVIRGGAYYSPRPLQINWQNHRYGLKGDWKLPWFHRIYTDHPCLPGSFGGHLGSFIRRLLLSLTALLK